MGLRLIYAGRRD